MSESDKSSRTEEATPKKVEDAFLKGQFAQSPEISVAFVLAAGTAVLLLWGERLMREIGAAAAYLFAHLGETPLTPESVAHGWREAVAATLGAAGPFLFVCSVAAVLAGGLQSRFRLTPKALRWSPERLDPIKGFKRTFGGGALVRAGFELGKFAAVGAVLYGAVSGVMADPIFHAAVGVGHLGRFIFDTATGILTQLAIAAALIALLHYLYQRSKTRRDLMMSKQEVKDERKGQEVDPVVKGQQRRMAMRLLQRQMLEAVPTADVVVTNPTHFAVALRYERGADPAPVVLAKGEDRFARKIKEIAAEHGVPTVEDKPAARALFRVGRVGEPIPAALYEVVAAILNHVYRTHRYYFHRLRARRHA